MTLSSEERQRAIKILDELKWLQSKATGGVDPSMMAAATILGMRVRYVLIDDDAMMEHLKRIVTTREPTPLPIAKASSRRRRKG